MTAKLTGQEPDNDYPDSVDTLNKRHPHGWLRERDIDLLLCSELHADGSLRRRFAELWDRPEVIFDYARVSVWENNTQIDLVVVFQCGPQKLKLLVENKIDAQFQAGQPERYRESAESRRKDDPTHEVKTVLLAPEKYFHTSGSESFDLKLSYEEVVRVLQSDTDPRASFLAESLEAGITKQQEGYQGIPDDSATSIWDVIWGMSREITPCLNMKSPGKKPRGSTWIHFTQAEEVSSGEIVWKMERGQVDLQFSKTDQADLKTLVANILEPDMHIEKAGKSASIRVKVSKIDFGLPPEAQEAKIQEGLRQAERLRRFFMDNGISELLDSFEVQAKT